MPDEEYVRSLAARLQQASVLRDEEIVNRARESLGIEQQAFDALPDTRPDMPAILSHQAFELTKQMRLLSRYPHLPHWLGGSAVKMSKMATSSFDGLYAYPQYPVPYVVGSFKALITPLLCATEAQTTDEATIRDGYVFMNPPHPSYKGWLIVDRQTVVDYQSEDKPKSLVIHAETYEVLADRRRWHGGGVRQVDYDTYVSPVDTAYGAAWVIDRGGWGKSEEDYSLFERLAGVIMGARMELKQ